MMIIKNKINFYTIFLYLIISANTFSFADDYDAYYNKFEWYCNIKGNKAIINVHKVLTIKNQRASEYSAVHLIEHKYIKIKHLNIKVSNNNGEVQRELNKKDFTKTCGVGGSYQVYTDICNYYESIIPLNYPFTIDYEYELELSSLFFLRGVQLVSELPVEQAIVEIKYPQNAIIHVKEYGLDIKRESIESNNKKILRWRANKIMPLNTDSLSLVDGSNAGYLSIVVDKFKFGNVNFQGANWINIGKWYYELSKDRYNFSRDNREAANFKNQFELVKEVYEAICEDNRYVAVHIGIGGWRPHSAKKTKKMRYGDCKDLSTLLISELFKKGVKAYPALILTKSEGYVDIDFPNFGFNHVITAAFIDDDTLWMDPTCNNCPFGDIPSQDENIPVLLVTENGGQIINTPASSHNENRLDKFARFIIGDDLRVNVQGEMLYFGNYARWLENRLDYWNKDEIKEYLSNRFQDDYLQFKVEEYSVDKIRETSSVKIRFNAFSKRKLRILNNTIYINPSPFKKGQRNKSEDFATLKRDYELGYPYTRRDSIIIICKKGDSLILPENTQLRNEIADFSYQYYVLNDSIIVSQIYSYKKYILPYESFEEFLNFESSIKEADNDFIKLLK